MVDNLATHPWLKWKRGSAVNIAQGCCLLTIVMADRASVEELRLS